MPSDSVCIDKVAVSACVKRHRVAPSPCPNDLEASFSKLGGAANVRGRYLSVLYRYPRLSYVAIVTLSSIVLGWTGSLAMTLWGFEAFNVPARLVRARQDANPQTFSRIMEMASCEYVRRPRFIDFPDLASQLDAARRYAQRHADANDRAIASTLTAASKCQSQLERTAKLMVKAAMKTFDQQETVDMQSCMTTFLDQLIGNFTAGTGQMWSSNTSQSSLASALISSLVVQLTDALYHASNEFDLQRVQAESLRAGKLVDQEIASLRNSTNQKLTSLIDMVKPSMRTQRRLSGASKLEQTLNSVSDEVLRLVGNLSLPGQDIEQLMAELSSFSGVNASQMKEKLLYFEGFVVYQLQATQLELDGEFQQSQGTFTASNGEAENLWQIVAAEGASTTKTWIEADQDDASDVNDEASFLVTLQASHALHHQATASPRNATTISPSTSSSVTYLPESPTPQMNLSDALANSTSRGNLTQPIRQGWTPPTLQDLQGGGSATDWLDKLWYLLIMMNLTHTLTTFVGLIAMVITGVAFSSDVIDARVFGSVKLVDGIWDLLFGRVTFVGLLYSFAIQGQEIARTATRIVLTATFSMGATALLLFMKFEHTKSCYQNGMHVDLSARADGKELEFSRTMFMRVWLPKFESEQSFSQMATDHADEMELHAYAMFEALQYEVNSVWADQAGLQASLSAFAELSSAAVLQFDSCDNNIAPLTFPSKSEEQQCELARSQSTEPLPMPTPPNTSAVLVSPISWPSNIEFVDLSQPNSSTSCPPLTSEELSARGATLSTTEARYLCGAEESLYLVLTSWLLFMFVFLLNNMINEMLVEVIDMIWWRIYTNDRFSFIGFCTRDGNIHPPQDLTEKIEIYMGNIWWRIAARVAAVISSILGVIMVWFVLLT